MIKEKQTKILNKLRKLNEDGAMGHQATLGKKNNDECYTSMQDILNELSYWGALGKFKGKNIICPCDWDICDDENIYSIEIMFKENDVEVKANSVYTAISRISLFEYDLFENSFQPEIKKIDLKENEIEDFLRNKLKCNFLRALTIFGREWGIKSITASGYNPDTTLGIPFQDVDYKKYDICITNPPFSLYSEMMKYMISSKIDFILLAPFMNRVNPNIGLNLMLKNCYLGKNIYIKLNFENPIVTNITKQKAVLCDWITSFPEAQDERNIENSKKNFGINYNLYKDEFKTNDLITMKDGTHPIYADARTFPKNYDGWILTNITLLNHLDLREYEWYGTNFKKYFNTQHPEANPFNHLASDKMMNGKFHGIVLRRIKKEETNNV